jgi:hypothetical protein
MMCEQTGQEIEWDRCPPEIEDFPNSVHTSMNIYNSLGDRIYGDVGYTGKDFTNLNLFFDLYKVDNGTNIISRYENYRGISETFKSRD